MDYATYTPEQAVKTWFLALANGTTIKKVAHNAGSCLAIAYKYSGAYGSVLTFGFGITGGPKVYTYANGTWT